MTKTQRQELRKKAERSLPCSDTTWFDAYDNCDMGESDAEFVAAASPRTIVELLDLVDHYEKNNELIKELLK
jgi:hypothetical protein